MFLRYSESFLDEQILKEKKNRTKINFDTFYNFEKWFDSYSTYGNSKTKIETKNFYKEIWISNDLRFAHSNFYQLGFLKNTRGTIILSVIDFYWTEHLERMNYIRETINWRSYGQQNPLIEYNIEAFKSFKLMFEEIQRCMLYYFLSNPINY